ncbi:MAG TPA: DNA-3-methyladenine glycosylase 2 family protein [Bryobacteraceae bacterium]|jgi:DNA-3-methyladenine glycosylase II|nr:DNA-3-methyladenine glycosylase 2 family protein [Bryobacteraceae bacterium]
MRYAIKHLKKSDPVIAAIIQRVGPYAMEYTEPSFETLVRSIIYQQLSGRVASVIFGRLHAAAGEKQLTPAGIMKLRPPQMRKAGLSAQKTLYIRELAKHTRRGSVVFETLPDTEDAAVIEHLTQVKGIGVWTAQMFLMFALRRQNVLRVADLGARTAIMRAYALPELPKPAEIERIAAVWNPYSSIACWYLWRSLENGGLA